MSSIPAYTGQWGVHLSTSRNDAQCGPYANRRTDRRRSAAAAIKNSIPSLKVYRVILWLGVTMPCTTITLIRPYVIQNVESNLKRGMMIDGDT